ncbi:hypothetical protein EG327_004226 [Venturia inaequalis]|uniref:Uncharacterized protein n=1 Tax=Venturia inaequalis TaxID=5025 RepID=A0A8H3Z5Z4_VENIN|nr:hypothetical protein EG327_004226 [Venturia inaequalis]
MGSKDEAAVRAPFPDSGGLFQSLESELSAADVSMLDYDGDRGVIIGDDVVPARMRSSDAFL